MRRVFSDKEPSEDLIQTVQPHNSLYFKKPFVSEELRKNAKIINIAVALVEFISDFLREIAILKKNPSCHRS